MYLLRAENISKTYSNKKGQKIEVVKSVDFELEENKITVIVGASGAGKSTLLHILSGLDKPDSGSVFIHNTNIFSLSENKLASFRNKKIGFIFQFYQLLPEFTAVENVSIPQMISGDSLKESLPHAMELLSTVGLEGRTDHKPSELSGGEQQRVAVARALMNKPEIIFADEPTGNLDSENSTSMHKLFIELKEKLGLTFLIVTHNPELVGLADIVYEMKDGKLIKK